MMQNECNCGYGQHGVYIHAVDCPIMRPATPQRTTPATDSTDLEARLHKAAELLEDLTTGQDCEEYAFATGKHFQAMTYNPQAFEALKALPEALDTLASQREEIAQLRAKMETNSTDLEARLRMFIAKASPLPWGIWFEEINGKADKAIQEFVEQVHATNPIGNSLVMLSDDNGKCPAITGCGPTSADNAALIANVVNAAPVLLDTLASQRAEITQLRDKLARAREALEDVVSPLNALQRKADEEGASLSGMAYSIANDLGFVRGIASQALKDTAHD